MSEARGSQVFEKMTAEPSPYRLVHMNGYEDDGGVFVNTFWAWRRPDDVAAVLHWQAFHGLDADAYQARFDDLVTRQGWQLAQIDTNLRDGQIRYSPILSSATGRTNGLHRHLAACDVAIVQGGDHDDGADREPPTPPLLPAAAPLRAADLRSSPTGPVRSVTGDGLQDISPRGDRRSFRRRVGPFGRVPTR